MTWQIANISGTAIVTWQVAKLSGTVTVNTATWRVATISGYSTPDIDLTSLLTVDPVAPVTITATLNNTATPTGWNWTVSGAGTITWVDNVATLRPGGQMGNGSLIVTASVTTASGTVQPAQSNVTVRPAYAFVQTSSGLRPMSYGQVADSWL